MENTDLENIQPIPADSIADDSAIPEENAPKEELQNSLSFDVAVKRTILILLIGAIILGIGGELIKPFLQ